ncbi:MAG: amino acid ABC transporter permease [Candidatus Bathyarchaeota archaeon]|nr:MAG: amino acid ABC transporter permease [Candidatus Bathyarchaeota archaeon]
MEFIIQYLPQILQGFVITAEVTLFGALAGLALGTLLAIGDLYGGKYLSTAITFYVEFFRGSPLIIQLFIFYFAVPQVFNILIDSFAIGLLIFSLNSAAYQKGYMKGSIEVVSGDQMMAARSIGLSRGQAIIHVVLPQALRLVIPAWGNEFASLTKSTAALLVIGVLELTGVAQTIAGQTFRNLEAYAFIAIIYLVWVIIVIKISDVVFEKVRIPGLEISK